MLTPWWTLLAVILAINLLFTAGILFKFVASLAGARCSLEVLISDEDVAALTDAELPTYTILVPVYREANVVGLLMANLAKPRLPRGQARDPAAHGAGRPGDASGRHRAARPPETVTSSTVPHGQPQTKPKACNVGLPSPGASSSSSTTPRTGPSPTS